MLIMVYGTDDYIFGDVPASRRTLTFDFFKYFREYNISIFQKIKGIKGIKELIPTVYPTYTIKMK